jgi:hypothetical protein
MLKYLFDRRLIFSAIAIVITCQSFAQSSYESVSQSAQWFALTSSIKLHTKASLLLEGQFRYVGNFEPMQMQFRTGVDIAVSKNLAIMPLGYVYIWNPIYGKQPASYVNNEHRIFQQVTYSHRLARAYIVHRARLEQRFIQVHENNNGEIINKGYELYLNRVRYRVLVNFPLNHPTIIPGTIYGSFYDELFVEFGHAVKYTDPDQNRFFAGLGYQLTKLSGFQAGYFYQKLIKLSGTMQENNIGFQVLFQHNFDLTKQ